MNCNFRCLGLDYGEKTVGVAVSDPSGRIALGVETIRRDIPEAYKADIRRLNQLVEQYAVTAIVLGYPKNMNNSVSKRCEAALRFKEKLEQGIKNVSVTLWDERLSTMAVERARGGSRRDSVDEMAAVYILQGYLDHLTHKREPRMQNDMNDFLQWDEGESNAITLFDDDGNASSFEVLASRELNGTLYLLAEELQEGAGGGEAENDDDEEMVEVLHFKCVSSDEEDMTFEIIDEDHEDFELMLELFKEDYRELDIEI